MIVIVYANYVNRGITKKEKNYCCLHQVVNSGTVSYEIQGKADNGVSKSLVSLAWRSSLSEEINRAFGQ